MSKIILQPAGNNDAKAHYLDTVLNNVSVDSIKPFISDQEFEILNDIYPSGQCKIWGVTPAGNNFTKWTRIKSGDVTLFSRDGSIYASAVTTFKIHNKSLASHLWGYNNKDLTWEYIYFLDELKSHNIPYLKFNNAVGYKENYIIQGFNVLRPDQSVSVLQAFDLQSEVYLEEVSKATYEELLSKLESLQVTEAEINSTRRLEQGYLKSYLFGKKIIGNCAGCKRDYPVSYLITAHIKKRMFCENSERKDLNIVMPMCKMGCDEIYEKGYISVLNGVFVDMSKSPVTNQLQLYIDQISGTECEYYNENTKAYFNWHFEHHK